MTDAPERIWTVHWNTDGSVVNGAWADTVRHFGGGVEYVRADIYRGAIEAAMKAGMMIATDIPIENVSGEFSEAVAKILEEKP
jgi:hypothetical protein